MDSLFDQNLFQGNICNGTDILKRFRDATLIGNQLLNVNS